MADNKAIQHLKEALSQGQHWYLALLEAVGLWEKAEEEWDGRHLRYLIDGEAFDWLLLAERLTEEVESHLPKEEVENLLFFGQTPVELSAEGFRKLIGDSKYKAWLNYFYGVIVEQALLLAEEKAVRKERYCLSLPQGGVEEEAWERIYGLSQQKLLGVFRREKGYHRSSRLSLEQFQEFTYWLFKYRLRTQEKARVASDTKRGLEFLHRLRRTKGRGQENNSERRRVEPRAREEKQDCAPSHGGRGYSGGAIY